MSFLDKLEAAGLSEKFDNIVVKHLKDEDDVESLAKIRDVVDSAGLKTPLTMKAVGELQSADKLNRGLYKAFVGLEKEFKKAVPVQLSKSETSSESEESPSGGSTVSEEVKDNVVELEDFKLTDKDEEKIKAQLQKEEEKARKRLLVREAKLRERLKARAEKRAQRQGMKLEEMQEIKEKKEAVAVLTEEIKERRDKVKKLREEIRELRPKRAKKEKSEDEEKAPPKKGKKKAS